VSIELGGPSAAQLAKCASCFAQDDGVWGWVGRMVKAAASVIELMGGTANKGSGKNDSFIG